MISYKDEGSSIACIVGRVLCEKSGTANVYLLV